MSVTLGLSQSLEDTYIKVAKEQNTTKEELMQKALAEYAEDLRIFAKTSEVSFT